MRIFSDFDRTLADVEDELILDKISGSNESLDQARQRYHKLMVQSGKTTYYETIYGTEGGDRATALYLDLLKNNRFDKLNLRVTPDLLKETVDFAVSLGVRFEVATAAPDNALKEPMERFLASLGVRLNVNVFRGGGQDKLNELERDGPLNPGLRNVIMEDSWKIPGLMVKHPNLNAVLVTTYDNSSTPIESHNTARVRDTDAGLTLIKAKLRTFEALGASEPASKASLKSRTY